MSLPVWPHVPSKVVWSQMGLVPEGGGGLAPGSVCQTHVKYYLPTTSFECGNKYRQHYLNCAFYGCINGRGIV